MVKRNIAEIIQDIFFFYYWLIISEQVSVFCLSSSQQFFSYIMVRIKFFLMGWWWWCLLCSRPACWTGFLKCWLSVRTGHRYCIHVTILRHIIYYWYTSITIRSSTKSIKYYIYYYFRCEKKHSTKMVHSKWIWTCRIVATATRWWWRW